MSYNGIGLQTPRGSGTSGYVQKNLTKQKNEGLRKKREREAQEELIREQKARQKQIRRSAGTGIKSHDRKRWIEVKCMELRDKLEDDDVNDEEVEKQVKELRERLSVELGKIQKENQEEKQNDGTRSLKEEEDEKTEDKIEEGYNKSNDNQGKSEGSDKSTRKVRVRISRPFEPDLPTTDLDNTQKQDSPSREPSISQEEQEVKNAGTQNAYSYVPRYADR